MSENLRKKEIITKLYRALFLVASAGSLHLSISDIREFGIFLHLLEDILKRQPFPKETVSENYALASAVRDYILENFTQPLPSIKELAKKLNTNDFVLKRSFSIAYGCGIYSYYNDIRLEFALGLVEQSKDSIYSICYSSGFSDYATFLKAFKKKYGQSPRRIRGNS